MTIFKKTLLNYGNNKEMLNAVIKLTPECIQSFCNSSTTRFSYKNNENDNVVH